MKNPIKYSPLQKEAHNRFKNLEQIKQVTCIQLEKSPQGKICISSSKNRTQFYLREKPSDKTGRYLGKDKENIIKIYLQKHYYEQILKIIDRELKVLKRFLGSYSNFSEQIKGVYDSLPELAKKYVMPFDLNDEEYAERWMKIPYQGKQFWMINPILSPIAVNMYVQSRS